MNQSLEGWKLALALLLPAFIIGGAGFLAYGALTGNDAEVVTGTDNVEQVETTPTAPPVPTVPAAPTVPPAPTALTLPTAAPVVVAPTAVPADTGNTEPAATAAPTAAPAPAPTSPPAPAPTSPPAPAPTATPAAPTVSVQCIGAMPTTLEKNEAWGPLTAAVFPTEGNANFIFTWNLGNGQTVSGASTGINSYSSGGTYNVSIIGTNAATNQTVSAQCGSIDVTEVVVTLNVTCSVQPVSTDLQLAAAKAGDAMRVTTNWTPADVPLTLQYEFETVDPIVFSNNAMPGDSQTNAFSTDTGAFKIFWRFAETGETGRISCPAYPGGVITGTPTPVPTADTSIPDADGDGKYDYEDNCPTTTNADQTDSDGDSVGDACDNCVNDSNSGQTDSDGNGEGTACDDVDFDFVDDDADNCPNVSNEDQTDTDGNGVGDACEAA